MRTNEAIARGWLGRPLTSKSEQNPVQEKPLLRAVYQEWYSALAAAVPEGGGLVLELGSGTGFLHEYIPGLIRSEICPTPGIELMADAHDIPFASGALRAVVMVNVLSYLTRPRQFFAEARRCVARGGIVTMVEPWVTPWSRFAFARLREAPLRPDAGMWEAAPGEATAALPWMLFQRDRLAFAAEFPEWEIASIRPLTPFRYLAGRCHAPAWSESLWRGLEGLARPCLGSLAMFAHVTLHRR